MIYLGNNYNNQHNIIQNHRIKDMCFTHKSCNKVYKRITNNL